MTVGGARGGRRVATALLLALLAAACTQAGRPRVRPVVSWQRVEPGGATRCARGGRYAFWARVADPSKLVVFFQGGGGCFDERSCALGSTWFDDSVTDADDPTHAGGMVALADPRNPFRDWSWVFIPSCGGDVHLGDRRVRYGSVTVQQRGWQNARAAMDWAFAHFRKVDAVLVAGCSAGSPAEQGAPERVAPCEEADVVVEGGGEEQLRGPGYQIVGLLEGREHHPEQGDDRPHEHQKQQCVQRNFLPGPLHRASPCCLSILTNRLATRMEKASMLRPMAAA